MKGDIVIVFLIIFKPISPCIGRSVVGTVYVTVDLWREKKWNSDATF